MQVRLSQPIVSFGTTATPSSVGQRRVIVRHCIVQQRWAFALVWFAVALGIILATLVVTFVIMAREFTTASVSSLAGLICDFSLAGSALRLYQLSNAHLDKALADIESKSD
jgi:hypothetical protein